MEEKSETIPQLSDDQKIHIASASAVIFAIFYAAGFGIGSIFIVLCSLFSGIAASHYFFGSVNGDTFDAWKITLVNYLFNENIQETDEIPSNDSCKKDSERTRLMPWHNLTIPNSLNESLEVLLNEIVEQYVNDWYGGGISRDRAFLNEIRYQLRYACANLVQCINKIDLSKFVAENAIPISIFHVTRLAELEAKIRKSDNGANFPRSMIETKMGEMLSDLHIALSGREQETDYLKQVSDFLIPRLIDETRLSGRSNEDDSPLKIFGRGKNERPWPSKSIRCFLREMITNAVLLPTIDMLTQPDTINNWLILLFDENRPPQISDPIDISPVSFLKGLSCDTSTENVPDSLLQLKLSEILRDARLYSMFRMYLQDIRGPVHELQFLSETTRIHESIQRKSESSSQIAYDIWQLYGQFVHESAQEKVYFDSEMTDAYKLAVESKDIEVLEGIIETSYQVVYNRMQAEHVVLFCQSECFLGHLCGSPPVTINELIDRDSQEKRKNVPIERTFSLSQLRARVRKALTSISDDDDEEEENEISEKPKIGDPQSPESQCSSNASSFVNVPAIDVITSDDEEGSEMMEESIAPSERLEKVSDEQQSNGLVMDTDARDLNNWKVNVTKVAPLKDKYTDRIIYVFVIDVERPDAKPHETQKWSIHRSFNEFYVLESKLNEFHGDSLRFAALPPRKTFVTKNRPFMEQHRLIFSTFLLTLCKQKILNRSDLLLAFLSSNEEFKDTLMLSDLNPWKVVRKMPGKLSREKGQNLKPFLLKTLATTLAPAVKQEKKVEAESDDKGSIDSTSLQNPSLATNAIYSSIYGNNFGGVVDPEGTKNNAIDKGIGQWTSSAFDSFLLYIWSVLKFHLERVIYVMSAVRSVFKITFDSTIQLVLKIVFQKCLCTENLVYLVQHLHYSLFCNDQPMATEQEMSMREELAKRRTLEYFQNIINTRAEKLIGRENMKEVIGKILEALQYPRMNKQLIYLLLDQLLIDVFSELSEVGHHPLRQSID